MRITRLLALLCISSAAFALSDSETNRPFINVRPYRNYSEAMTTFHKSLAMEKGDRMGAFFQLVPFYQQTRDPSRDELGKGFGVNHKNGFTLTDCTATDNSHATETAVPATADVESRYLIHARHYDVVDDELSLSGQYHVTRAPYANVTIKPQHKAMGINLYHIDRFDEIVEGLFFKFATGIVKEEHKVEMESTGELVAQEKIGSGVANWVDVSVTTANSLTFSNFLRGTANTTPSRNLQAALKYGKVNDDEIGTSSGFNDVEFGMGWQFVRRENANLSISADLLIPTGKETTAEFLFEPKYGTRHFQLGGTLNGDCVLYKGNKGSIKMLLEANYRYGFERQVKRLMTLKKSTYGNYGHLHLLANTSFVADTPLEPAANVLACDVKATPGHMLDGSLMVSVNTKFCAMDIGYNLYTCQAQHVEVVNWLQDYYYRVHKNYDTHATFATNQSNDLEGIVVNKSDIDTTCDSQIIHRVFAGLGIVTVDWKYPVTIGVGGSFEFVQGSRKQITPQNWELFGKFGVNF